MTTECDESNYKFYQGQRRFDYIIERTLVIKRNNYVKIMTKIKGCFTLSHFRFDFIVLVRRT